MPSPMASRGTSRPPGRRGNHDGDAVAAPLAGGNMVTRRRTRARRPAARHAVAVGVIVAAMAALVAAFLLYRRTLEHPDPYADRVARSDPDRISVRRILVRHPLPEGQGMAWSETLVPSAANHPSTLGRLVVTTWAARVAECCGMPPTTPAIARFFYDERRVVYIDLEPTFLTGCAVGTTGETELIESLEETVRANLPAATAIVLAAGGVPVDTPWGHISLEPWKGGS